MREGKNRLAAEVLVARSKPYLPPDPKFEDVPTTEEGQRRRDSNSSPASTSGVTLPPSCSATQ
ncbi:hypothetical protein N7471_001506 [Penicillium samsonianum]|uniref:uncharacterized protein n=1 Tax=Penicillium samsonianum TaxID=1882272 RepID=UPI0025484AB5|nr:uncharacterized protein N7471_001506 [Penicillium samsonianum]KAJ6150307.1 hypothetical protein N7471_001506 [Penicillium samsonianum]